MYPDQLGTVELAARMRQARMSVAAAPTVVVDSVVALTTILIRFIVIVPRLCQRAGIILSVSFLQQIGGVSQCGTAAAGRTRTMADNDHAGSSSYDVMEIPGMSAWVMLRSCSDTAGI